jgi:hypothetical protein
MQRYLEMNIVDTYIILRTLGGGACFISQEPLKNEFYYGKCDC